jgi:hypothetical protein
MEAQMPHQQMICIPPIHFYTSLAGTYTIGGFAPDFNLVSDALTILNASGIVNNVIFQFPVRHLSRSHFDPDYPRINYNHIVTFHPKHWILQMSSLHKM